MKTTDHLRKHPRALPSTLAFIELRNAKCNELKREIAAAEAARKPSRKSIIQMFMPWFAGRKANWLK